MFLGCGNRTNNYMKLQRMVEEEKPISDIRLDFMFPAPVYYTHRKSDLDLSEIKEIEDIIKEDMGVRKFDGLNNTSFNSYIFDTKLHNLKEFCEKHIEKYVEKIINPKEELDFYITQSWLNVTKPGQRHHVHHHPNSIISGVFYVSAIEGDAIQFYDSGLLLKNRIDIVESSPNKHNSITLTLDINNGALVLFPSWLMHGVKENKSATTNRISIAFNVFAKGTIGAKIMMTELVLE